MKRLKRFIILTVGMLVWTDNWTTEEAFWRRVENVFKNLTLRTYTEILIWVVSISMKMSTMKFLLILFRKQSKDSLYYYSIWIPVKNIFTHLTLKIVFHICLEVPSIHLFSFSWSGSWGATQPQYLQSVEPSENSNRHENRIKICNCLKDTFQVSPLDI